jgi:exopolysaccharide production protein ExoZ
MDRAGTRRLVGVQYLRAVAALLVVYFHISTVIPEFNEVLFIHRVISVARFTGGVDIFFVISGFIMAVTTSSRTTPQRFLMRRIIRIVPLYWLLTLALAAAAAIPPHFYDHAYLTLEFFLKSLLFIAYINPIGGILPLVPPGWTLNVEMFFYLVFTLALFAPVQRRLPIVAGLFVLLVALGALIPDRVQLMPPLWLVTRPYVLEFVVGMWIGSRYQAEALRLPLPLCALLIVAGFCGLLGDWGSWRNFAAWPIVFSGSVVLGVVAMECKHAVPRWWLPAFLGDASYSIYLSHVLAIGIVKKYWGKFGLVDTTTAHALLFAGAAGVLALIGGALVFKLLEKPLHDKLTAVYRAHSEASTSSAAFG